MSGGASVRVGVAAVDASTGDVAHDEFEDGAMRPELEARLLRVAPAEVLLVEPVSAETAKLVAAMYGGGENGRGAFAWSAWRPEADTSTEARRRPSRRPS